MNDSCPACGRKFNRAPGYFLGSIFFNYGVTAVLMIVHFWRIRKDGSLSGPAPVMLASEAGKAKGRR